MIITYLKVYHEYEKGKEVYTQREVKENWEKENDLPYCQKCGQKSVYYNTEGIYDDEGFNMVICIDCGYANIGIYPMENEKIIVEKIKEAIGA